MAEWTLRRILDADLCAGCGACVAVLGASSGEMQLTAEGFLRPVPFKPLDVEQEASVRAVCPGIHLAHPTDLVPGTSADPIWGPIRRVFAGHAEDAEVRHRGSSGGVLSALLIHLLESGAVDFVVQTRAVANDPLRNEIVFSRTRDDVLAASGSRYSPAAPVTALEPAFADGGRFAFVGKPCDVAAVRKYLALQPRLAGRIPYLLSFMCAGTPSQHGTSEILQRMQVAPEEVVQFRYRGDGWPGSTRAVTREGRTEELDYNTAWGKVLNRHLQTRCKLCADGTGEFADIVCADAWFGRDGYPEFDERDGRSLVISRTPVGTSILAEAIARNRVRVEDFKVASIRGIQPYQHRRKSELLARLAARWICVRRVPKFERMGLRSAALKAGSAAFLRAFIGSLSRLFRGRM